MSNHANSPVWGQCQNWTDMEIFEYRQFSSYKTAMFQDSYIFLEAKYLGNTNDQWNNWDDLARNFKNWEACSLDIYKVSHVKCANASKLYKLDSKDLLLLETSNSTQQLSWSKVSIPIAQADHFISLTANCLATLTKLNWNKMLSAIWKSFV